MIKKLLLTSAILLSGCSGSGSSDNNCWFNSTEYQDYSLKTEYDAQKSAYLEQTSKHSLETSKAKSLLKNNKRWDSLEVYLIPEKGSFPFSAGFYKISKDYTQKNCLKNYMGASQHEVFNLGGESFCLSAVKIKEPTAIVKLMITDVVNDKEIPNNTNFLDNLKDDDNNTMNSNIDIFVNNKLYLQKHVDINLKSNADKTCLSNHKTTKM